MFKKILYGHYKKEIRVLQQKRLVAKEKLRYHNKQTQKFQEQIITLESQIETFIGRVKGKIY